MFKTITVDHTFSVLWQFKDHAGEYPLAFLVCDSPFCKCPDITLLFQREQGKPQTSAVFNLNLKRRELIHQEKLNAAALFFAHHVLCEMQDSDWEILDDMHRSLKKSQTEKYDPHSGILPKFNTRAIEASQMLEYNEFFPWSVQLRFKLDATTYVVDNYYCLRQECNCHEILLSFIPFIDQKQQMRGLYPSLLYDYHTHGWRERENWSSLDPSPELLLQTLTAQVPDFATILADRYNRLKIMYQRYRGKHPLRKKSAKPEFAGPPPTILKIAPKRSFPGAGRNEPCPCGSGLKYKKCCGKNT